MRDEVTQYQTDAANAATRAWGLYRVDFPDTPEEWTEAAMENDDAVLLSTYDSQREAQAAADAAFDRFHTAGHVAPLLDVVPGWVVDGEFCPDE